MLQSVWHYECQFQQLQSVSLKQLSECGGCVRVDPCMGGIGWEGWRGEMGAAWREENRMRPLLLFQRPWEEEREGDLNSLFLSLLVPIFKARGGNFKEIYSSQLRGTEIAR